MKYRKILLITLVVLVLVALMYKMSEMYTAPPNVEGIVRQLSSDLNLSNVQTEFVAYLFTTGMEPSTSSEIGNSFTKEQIEAIKAEFKKYKPATEPVKRAPGVKGFSCSKLPNNKNFMCSFS